MENLAANHWMRSIGGAGLFGDFAAHEGQLQREGVHGDQLGTVGLGGGDGDLGSGEGIEDMVRLAGNGGAHDVHDGQGTDPEGLGLAQGGQAVGGLAGLGDDDDEGFGIQQLFAVAELGGQLDPGGELGQILEDVLGGHAHMPGGAAGNDVHGGDIGQKRIGESGPGQVDPAVLQNAVQGIADSGGLFVDLLEHEMLIAALFGGLGVPGDLGGLVLDHIAVQVIENDLARGEARHLEIADVIDRAGMLQNGRDIGGQIALAVGDAENHGAVLPGGEDLAGVVAEHQGEGIGAADTDHGARNRVHGAELVFLVIVVDQLDDHLGIGLGIEGIAVPQELGLELGIVLDNAVVDADDTGLDRAGAGAGAVAADMRMGVGLAGLAVGGPAGMTDAAGAGKRAAVVGFFGEVPKLAGGFDHLGELRPVPDGQAGGVIAAVFELLQPFQQNRGGLMRPGETDNSAHMCSSLKDER